MQNKNIIFIGILSVITILGIVLINNLFKNGIIGPSDNISSNEIVTKIVQVDDVVSVNGTKTDEIKNSRIVVEIKGEVVYPGIYEFDTNEVLIQDVINMAGGLTKRADTSLINLASLVSNHSSITIGSIESKSYVLGEGEIQNKININTCTVEELESLEGIGESKAIQIINYRKVNGFFQTIEDIKNVSGVGDAVYQKIKDYITV